MGKIGIKLDVMTQNSVLLSTVIAVVVLSSAFYMYVCVTKGCGRWANMLFACVSVCGADLWQMQVCCVCVPMTVSVFQHCWSSACSLFNSLPPVENIQPNICMQTDFSKNCQPFVFTLCMHVCLFVCVQNNFCTCACMCVRECSAHTVNTKSTV